ncbi:l-2-hydroxyglutarate dehydrogenase, mitochondrial [Trichonephila clavipes]|nr:l-2-hydroxyglutarate dehydrogenase, mitochondrial [Trichonephila clavipes]
MTAEKKVQMFTLNFPVKGFRGRISENPKGSVVVNGPLQGDYLVLKPDKAHLVKTNIYPVPYPNLPFLGVHITPRIDGSVWLGPNAVLASHKEGYRGTNFKLTEAIKFFEYRGLRKLAAKHFMYGLTEMYRGINIFAQVQVLQQYMPSLSSSWVERKGKNAVQARKKLTDVYGEGVLTVHQCQNWFAKFRSGNFDVEDDPRLGRPVEADKKAIKALVDANRQITPPDCSKYSSVATDIMFDKGIEFSMKYSCKMLNMDSPLVSVVRILAKSISSWCS